ncbi:hypothetical protein [Roseovarius sp. A-2]|uniref:hypothetical protein n=1 Tax=Roseovarius sp. A-2 TaxID=1570360 RepID=UPI0009B51D60|nr:hypothetical protein [Roseovarius sp. A-2]
MKEHQHGLVIRPGTAGSPITVVPVLKPTTPMVISETAVMISTPGRNNPTPPLAVNTCVITGPCVLGQDANGTVQGKVTWSRAGQSEPPLTYRPGNLAKMSRSPLQSRVTRYNRTGTVGL